MRPTLLLPILLAACGAADAPACDWGACEDECVKLATGNSFDARSGRLVTADEVRRLRTELDDLRRGARLDPAKAGLCAGDAGCDTPLGPAPRLAPGRYHLHLAYALPRRALAPYWDLTVYTSCVDADAQGSFTHAVEKLSSRSFVLGDLAGTVDAEPFEVVADAPARACAWRAFLRAENAEDVIVEGRWRSGAADVAADVAPDTDGAHDTDAPPPPAPTPAPPVDGDPG